MKISVAKDAGYCFGVRDAVNMAYDATEKFGSVYMLGDIVHNERVVNDLANAGAKEVETLDDIPDDSPVLFRAHGTLNKLWDESSDKNMKVIDATCPLVTKVHNEAKKYSKDGRKLILVGHEGHQEVKGTMGQEQMHLIDDREKINPNLPKWEKNTPLTILTQTTLSEDDTQRSISTIQNNFNKWNLRSS